MFLAFVLSPFLWPIPHYPISPIFQRASNLQISIDVGKSSEPIQLKGIWLRFGQENHSYKDFQFSSNWILESDKYLLRPNSQGKLTWQGKIGEHATLYIFPLDTQSKVTVLWDEEEGKYLLGDKTITIQKKSSTSIYYYAITSIVTIICLGFLLFLLSSYLDIYQRSKYEQIIIIILVCLSLYTVYAQFNNYEIKGRLYTLQLSRHNAVIAGTSPNPWQYRVLAEWIIEGISKIASSVEVREPYVSTFVLVRIIQNAVIFTLAHWYFRELGFPNRINAVGMLFVSGSLLNSFFQSDLSFNTYFDLIFYLTAVLLILRDSFSWLPILTLFASLNRETSGLIPLLALLSLPTIQKQGKRFAFIALSFVIWLGIFLYLRIYYPPNELMIPHGIYPGIPLLKYNLSIGSLQVLIRFFSFAPVFGIISYKHWTFTLKRFFIAIIPVWILIHFVGSVVSESRLFLVPQFLILIPAFLTFIQKYLSEYSALTNGASCFELLDK